MAALEKERPNLPAKAPPKPKSAAAAPKAVRGGMRAAASQDSLDAEEDEETPAPAKAVRGKTRPASKTRVSSRVPHKSDF